MLGCRGLRVWGWRKTTILGDRVEGSGVEGFFDQGLGVWGTGW